MSERTEKEKDQLYTPALCAEAGLHYPVARKVEDQIPKCLTLMLVDTVTPVSGAVPVVLAHRRGGWAGCGVPVSPVGRQLNCAQQAAATSHAPALLPIRPQPPLTH